MTAPELVAAEKAVGQLKDYMNQRRPWRARRNQQVREACAVASLLHEFVDKLLSRNGEVNDSLRRAVRGDDTYVEVFGKVGAAAGEFHTYLATFDGVGDAAIELVDRLFDLADEMLSMLDAALNAFETAVNAKADTAPEHLGAAQQTAGSFAYGMHRKVQVRQAILRSARRSLDASARRRVENQVRAHRHYTEIERQEQRAADRLGRGVIGLLAAVAVSLVVLAVFAGTEILRDVLLLGATAPLLMLAGFLGLEASAHRSTARWAREQQASAGPVGVDVPEPAIDVREPPADDPDDRRAEGTG